MSYDHDQGMETLLIFRVKIMKAILKLWKKYKIKVFEIESKFVDFGEFWNCFDFFNYDA